MGRFGIAIGLLVCALGSAEPARALSECTQPLLSIAYDAPGERPFFTAPTADDLALALERASARASAHASANTPAGDEEPPWCVNPEDPRCSPLPGHSVPHELATRTFSTPGPTCELPDAPEAHEVACTAAAGLPAASGVHHRLERPPRATRRPL